MKTLLTLSLLILSALTSLAQTNDDVVFEYSYDDKGNQETRLITPVVLRQASTETAEEEATEEELVFGLYPNPASSEVQIELSETALDGKAVQLNLYNAQAQLLLSLSTEELKTSLDVSGYAKGTYFIEVQTHDKLWVKQLVLVE